MIRDSKTLAGIRNIPIPQYLFNELKAFGTGKNKLIKIEEIFMNSDMGNLVALIVVGVIIYLLWKITIKSYEAGSKNLLVKPEDFNYLNPINYIYILIKKLGPILLLFFIVLEIAIIVDMIN